MKKTHEAASEQGVVKKADRKITGRSLARAKRVAVAVIGDEILAGEVREFNATFMARELTRLGAAVERILVLPDREALIARELRALSRACDAVLVSGGIGVTHDDVTRQAVARAFGLPLAENRGALRAIRERFREKMNPWRRKLAELPRPCRLIPNPVGAAPGFIVHNVYVFPGVPGMLREMLPLVAAEFAGPPLERRLIYTRLPESAFAGPLGEIARGNRDVSIGSYPLPPGQRFRVRLVLKSRGKGKVAPVAGAVRAMLARLERGPESESGPDQKER